jgi:hypothetical protein
LGLLGVAGAAWNSPLWSFRKGGPTPRSVAASPAEVPAAAEGQNPGPAAGAPAGAGQPRAGAAAAAVTERPGGDEPVARGATAATVAPSAAADAERPGRHLVLKPSGTAPPRAESADAPGEPPRARALRIIAECQARYQAVRDYTCTFFKRERIDGRLVPEQILAMKVRTQPRSIYVKFRQPSPGREAIYIAGQNGGKVLAHDVGLNKLLAGTLWLEPTCGRAMQDCRHPITEAGIGPLLETLKTRWSRPWDPAESVVFRADQPVGPRLCTLIETTHPRPRPDLMFYRVRVFIDNQLGLPIRFEAYDWPQAAGSQTKLVEEYTYADLRLNVGLEDRDFDVSNAEYAFGRF